LTRQSFPFEVRSADVARIAVPASIAFITEPVAGLVDITVIGRLGDAAILGGVVIGALIFDFIFSLAYFLRIGTAGLTAQSVGTRDPDDGVVHAVRAIVVAVVAGLAMILLQGPLFWLAQTLMAPGPGVAAAFASYFAVRIWAAPFALINYALLGWFYGRAAAATGMALQMVMHGVNVALSIGLVYGLGWGVEGVAAATVAGSVASCLVGLVLLVRHFGGVAPLLARLDRRELLDPAGLRRMFGLSRDLMIRSIALMSAYAVFAAQGARMGAVALSGNAILLNFLMIGAFFLDGMAQAAEQLCGKAVGANWRPAFDRAYALSFRWATLMALGLAVAAYFGGGLLIDFMTTSEPVRDYARTMLPLAAVALLLSMPGFLFDGILAGITLNQLMRNGMLISLVVFLAGLWLFQPLGSTGLWLALSIWFVARAAYYWWGLRRRVAGLFT
jgi:putative MATE family efflux protein